MRYVRATSKVAGGEQVRAISLALQGIWWRRWASLALLLVGVVCAAVAAAGPIFAIAARESVLHESLIREPADASGTGISVVLPIDAPAPDQLSGLVARSFAALHRAGFLGATVHGQQAQVSVLGAGGAVLASTLLVERQDVCAHIVIRAGRCLTGQDAAGVLISTDTAATRDWHVGTQAVIGTSSQPARVRVRGIYEPRRPASQYWFGRAKQFFDRARSAPAAAPATDAVLVSPGFWTTVLTPRIGDNVMQSVDLSLRLTHLRVGEVPRLRALVEQATGRAQQTLSGDGSAGLAESRLPSDLRRAEAATRAVTAPVFVVTVQLLVLTWLVLFLLLAGSAESRTGEIVLGKLRGLRPRDTALHALLEPALLISLAVPLGVGVAHLAIGLARPSVFGDVVVPLPATAWWAAVVAGLGGLVAGAVAATGALRRSVLDQWRRTLRRPARGSWAFELVVVALAVAALLDLSSVPTLATGTAISPAAQVLPAGAAILLATAVAVVAARLLPFAARAAIGPTRASGAIALFFTARQIARRPADLRVFLLLAVAVALGVFGVAGRTVFLANRTDRALTDVGAARVVSIGAPAGIDAAKVVDRLDPGGREAAAVYSGPMSIDTSQALFRTPPTRTRPRVLVVDPSRFAAVAFWRDDFGDGRTLSQELRPLRRPPPKLIDVGLTGLRMTGSVTLRSGYPATLYAGLTTKRGEQVRVKLATVAPTVAGGPARALRIRVAVPRCSAGCAVRELSLQPYALEDAPAQATVSLSSAVATGPRGTRDLLPALRSSSWTSLDRNALDQPAVTVRPAGDGLDVVFAPAYTPEGTDGFTTVAGLPRATPALITSTQVPRHGGRLAATVGPGAPLALAGTTVSVLPRAGDAGLVLPTSWLPNAAPDGFARYAPNQVWLGVGAPADFPRQLARAGLTVFSVQTAAARAHELAATGPALAITMLAFGAAAAGALAVAGATASLLLAARRRRYEFAVVRSLGVRRSRVLGAVALEHATVCGVSSVVGAAAGLVGARLALTRLPEFGDHPEFPALDFHLPVLRCVLLTLGVVFVVATAAAIGGFVLIRDASVGRLREAQA